MILSDRLKSEKVQGDTPMRAVSIGKIDDDEIMYAIHKEGESSEEARKRVKKANPNVTEWIDFEPENPGPSTPGPTTAATVLEDENVQRKKKKEQNLSDIARESESDITTQAPDEAIVINEDDMTETSVAPENKQPEIPINRREDKADSDAFKKYFETPVRQIVMRETKNDDDSEKDKRKKGKGSNRRTEDSASSATRTNIGITT
jgi:hypothetical protein